MNKKMHVAIMCLLMCHTVQANRGYDMEELATGVYKGYCVQLPYDQPSGLYVMIVLIVPVCVCVRVTVFLQVCVCICKSESEPESESVV